MRVTNLRCEYRHNPLGIDVASPRLSWKVESSRRGARQTAYQVIVAQSEEALQRDQGELWDSGVVRSDQSIHVAYEGRELRSGQRAFWKVRIWDEANELSDSSECGWWEMGLLEPSEWCGQWIGASLAGGPRTTIPCPYLRKIFFLDKPVAVARLYATALGLYEFHLNGQRIGSDVFTPGWTDYRKRVQYQVYDITSMVRQGENAAGVILGDGWYCGFVGWFERQFYGDRPKLLSQLHLTFTDGSSQIVATDNSWMTNFGPLLESDLLMGESYDARREMPGWDVAGFDDTSWRPAEVFNDPGIEISAMRGPAVRRQEELRPISLTGQIFDMGQNMVGRVRLKINGPAGTTIQLRHGEALNPDGTLYTANLRKARATDYYTLKGGGEEIWEPRFTFHGFRYVEVTGYPGNLPSDAVTGIVLHSAMESSGEFECSHPLVNQLQKNIRWGQKGNFLEVPTDCPQRDERLGWTGDAQVFIRTAAFNHEVAGFFTKWQRDIADAQSSQGSIPSVVPNVEPGNDGGPAWSDATIICPWTIYLCYGDVRILAESYPTLTHYFDYLESISHKGIRNYEGCPGWAGFGDWLALDGSGKTDGGTPKDLIGTAFFAHSAQLMSHIANVLGKHEDATKYLQLFEKVKAAFIQRFVTPKGQLTTPTQTACVLALQFDLLPAQARRTAQDSLVRDIEKRDMHLSTGFVGTPYLNHVLTSNGYSDVAYKLLLQETWPSWLYAVTQGATTIWERWDGWTHDKGFQDPGMNSFNHYAYGAIGAWLYQCVAGVDIDPSQPGYKHVVLRPCLGEGIIHARASFESLYGRITSHWSKENENFEWRISLPPNTEGTVCIPCKDAQGIDRISESGHPAQQAVGVFFKGYQDGTLCFEIESGQYHFVLK